MTDQVLRSRKSNGVAVKESNLEAELKYANAIAEAKQAIPAAYQKNPGAVLLAQEWASARGIDLLTTIQTVAFISGKPVIDATMQRALAKRAGYDVTVEVGADSATVGVSQDGKEIGKSTYTMADAKLAELDKKDNWRKNPKAMLVARATAQTMRWYAPDVMVGVFTEDELDAPIDILTPLVEDVIVEGEVDDAEVVDAEVVEDPAPTELFELLAAASKGLTAEQKKQFAEFGDAEGWPEKRAEMTQAQVETALQWIEKHA